MDSDHSTTFAWGRRILAPTASLKLAVVLIAIYAIVLAWATLIESRYGMAAAHFGIYDTSWFAAIHWLLGINILSAVLIRIPWQRHQLGFLMTHGGILCLLIGCLLSRQLGVEAQLSVFEGHAASHAVENTLHFELQIASNDGNTHTFAIPFVSGPFSWERYKTLAWFPWHAAYRTQGVIYNRDGIRLEVLDYTQAEPPSAKVRLSVNDKSKEIDTTADDDKKSPIVADDNLSANVALKYDTIPLGFQVYLHQFQRKLDPGTGAASHYSSFVDILAAAPSTEVLQKNVLITLNAPVDLSDPASGCTYRLFQSSFTGPWLPGEAEFDRLVGRDQSRDRIYRSTLSVNHDPGRGLKYMGSLFIVAGILFVYYLKPERLRAKRKKAAVSLAVVLFLFAVSDAQADALDWSEWRELPVFGEGRIVPLDTFARDAVESICGRADPILSLPGESPRKYSAAELVFAWLAEPERWENMPFLLAADAQLRVDVLGVPLQDETGRRLRFISPAEAENNAGLGQFWAAMQAHAESDGKAYRPAGVEKQAKALVDAYTRFRFLARNAVSPKDAPQRFYARVRSAAKAWRSLAMSPDVARRIREDEEVQRLMVQAGESLQKMMAGFHGEDFSPEKVLEPATAFFEAGRQLGTLLDDAANRPMAAMAAAFRRETAEMILAMYDNGEQLRLSPSLSIASLEENRTPEDDASPWLGFQPMMQAPETLLCDYPQAELKKVRETWAEVKQAYVDRGAADRAAKFQAAMKRFVAAVRTLGEKTEPIRRQLPIVHRDQTLIDATVYPPLGSTQAELFYNRLDPFFWSWVISLAATVALLLAVRRLQKPLFWIGLIVLVTAQGFTLDGFALRMYLSGLVPLTGMFETVVFVALCVAVLGLWFTLWPLFGPGLRAAWRMMAFKNQSAIPRGLWVYGLLAMRAGLIVAVFWLLARWDGRFTRGIFDLLPPVALNAAVPSTNGILVWLSGLGVLAASVYYLPRIVVSFAASLFTVPYILSQFGSALSMKQVLERRLFLLAGAIISFLATMLAYYAPATVMHRNIGSAAPVLRDNFWLVVHVVTIIASYGSAAIALILGNIALGYYFIGHYENGPKGDGCRPPAQCTLLAGYIYTAIQITVLLLAAGTILGALWADKAWGRFWAWDPKEVWALISLLVYAGILHARCAGWTRDFGMAVAAVLGATAVLFTWYGVNFLLGSGMHSYGAGAGGQWQVASAVIAEWMFLAFAGARYGLERRMMQDDTKPNERTS